MHFFLSSTTGCLSSALLCCLLSLLIWCPSDMYCLSSVIECLPPSYIRSVPLSYIMFVLPLTYCPSLTFIFCLSPHYILSVPPSFILISCPSPHIFSILCNTVSTHPLLHTICSPLLHTVRPSSYILFVPLLHTVHPPIYDIHSPW